MLIVNNIFGPYGEFNTVVKKSKDFWNPQNFISCFISSFICLSIFSLFELGMKSNFGRVRVKDFSSFSAYPIQHHDRFICVTIFFTKMDMDALCLVFFHLVNLWILSKNRHTFPGHNFLLWPVAISPWPAVLPSTEERCVTAAIPPDWRSEWSSLTGYTGLGMRVITTAQSSARLWRWTLMERE